MSEELKVTYNEKISLTAPPEGLALILVRLEMKPEHSGCIIYGWSADGHLGQVQVTGSQDKLELPFVKPEIYIKHLKGLKSIKVWTLGFKMDDGA